MAACPCTLISEWHPVSYVRACLVVLSSVGPCADARRRARGPPRWPHAPRVRSDPVPFPGGALSLHTPALRGSCATAAAFLEPARGRVALSFLQVIVALFSHYSSRPCIPQCLPKCATRRAAHTPGPFSKRSVASPHPPL